MKYLRATTSFSAVPKEISLAIEITNCPHRCEGCHSPELCENIGIPLNELSLVLLFEKFCSQNKPLFTCVTFMGGDQESDELINLIEYIQSKYPHLKMCLYTGSDSVNSDLMSHLNYLKTGRYIEKLGPLGSPTTNQKFIEIGEL